MHVAQQGCRGKEKVEKHWVRDYDGGFRSHRAGNCRFVR